MKPLPRGFEGGKPIQPDDAGRWNEEQLDAIKIGPKGKKRVFEVKNAEDRPYSLFNRSGAMTGTDAESKQLNRRFVDANGEPIDYDPELHELDDETEANANWDESGWMGVNSSRSRLGKMYGILSGTRLAEKDFRVSWSRKAGADERLFDEANADYIRRFPASSPDYRPESSKTDPAESIRAAGIQTKGALGMISMTGNPATVPEDSFTAYRGNGLSSAGTKGVSPFRSPSQEFAQMLPAAVAQSKMGPQSAQSAQSEQSAYNSFQSLPPVRNTSAKAFDEYLNQALQNPNSSISTGLANMRAQASAKAKSYGLQPNESADSWNGRMIAAGVMRPEEAGIPDLGDTGDDSAGEYQRHGLSQTGVFDTRVLAHFRDQDNQQRLNNEWNASEAADRAYTSNMYDHVVKRERERSEPFDRRDGKPYAPAINAYNRISTAAAQGLRRPQGQSTRPQFPY